MSTGTNRETLQPFRVFDAVFENLFLATDHPEGFGTNRRYLFSSFTCGYIVPQGKQFLLGITERPFQVRMGYAAFAERFKGRNKAVVGGREAVRGGAWFAQPFRAGRTKRSKSRFS